MLKYILFLPLVLLSLFSWSQPEKESIEVKISDLHNTELGVSKHVFFIVTEPQILNVRHNGVFRMVKAEDSSVVFGIPNPDYYHLTYFLKAGKYFISGWSSFGSLKAIHPVTVDFTSLSGNFESNLAALKNWARESNIDSLVEVRGTYSFNFNHSREKKDSGSIKGANSGIIVLVNSKDGIPLSFKDGTDTLFWKSVINQTSLTSQKPLQNIIVSYNDMNKHNFIFYKNGELSLDEDSHSSFGELEVTKEYLQQKNVSLRFNNGGVVDLSELCNPPKPLKKNFKVEYIPGDFQAFLKEYYRDKQSAKLDPAYDQFGCEAIVRGLSGEIINGNPYWEKIDIKCLHSSVGAKCIVRVIVNGSLCSGIGSYPKDLSFTDSMDPKYSKYLDEYENKLSKKFRIFLLKKYAFYEGD